MLNWLPWFKTSFSAPDVRFGRYSDAHKNDTQIDYWNRALNLFGEKKYLESYENFFKYIADDSEQNVQYTKTKGQITFQIQQGSKTISGVADEKHCAAETTVATFNELNVVFMRKLLEFNYQLKYSRYSIDGNSIKLSFDTSTLDGSPEKLYFGLREVATHSDRQDDVLINEFQVLSQLENNFIKDIPEFEKEIKYKYIQVWINQAFHLVNELDSNQNDVVISQILLCTAFKIDYLIVPQGKIMNDIERIQQIYFVPDGSSRTEKNDSILTVFNEILVESKEQIFEELYSTRATFGVTQPVAHESLTKFLDDESPKSTYIKNKQQFHIHLFVQEYISQYILFFWGVNPPTRKLLHLVVRVINEPYFNELGFKPNLYSVMDDQLNKTAISDLVQAIEKGAKQQYNNVKIDANLLKFESIPFFVESVFDLIKRLNYD